MRKTFVRALVFVVAFLLFAGIVSAAHPPIHQFSTTGYTTAYAFAVVPSGQAKFHLFAGGSPDDPLCAYLLGQPCGVSGDLEGSFGFEEWGLADLVQETGVNHGDMTVVTTDGDTADFHFGGVSGEGSVSGSFKATGGTGAYENLEAKGTYSGDAGLTFTVDWETCGSNDTPPCPVDRCAVFGNNIKIHKKMVQWQIKNEGEQPLTLSSVLLNWPDENGSEVRKVKFGRHTVFTEVQGNPPVVPFYPDQDGNLVPVTGWWYAGSAPAGIQINPGQKMKLKVEFADKNSSELPSDYTFQLQFEEGCGVAYVSLP